MYHALVRRKLTRVFAELSRGNYEFALAGMAPRFGHVFPGSHPLGGTRHTAAAMRPWFQRLYRLAPGLNFTLKHVAASGPPWDTTAVVEWRGAATLASGEPYVNDGAHVIRMRWGKVVSLHEYLDTEVLADACRRMAEQGIAEAAAEPIED
jgi:ketosteroid isomerase-like protein